MQLYIISLFSKYFGYPKYKCHTQISKELKPKTQSEYQQKKQWASKRTIRSTIGAKKDSHINVFVFSGEKEKVFKNQFTFFPVFSLYKFDGVQKLYVYLIFKRVIYCSFFVY